MDIPLSITLPWLREQSAPAFTEDTDKFPESLPRYFIKNLAPQRNSRIFDPFMGLGTTAFVAEDLGHTPYGIEHDELRCEWSAGQLEHYMNIKCADAAQMDRLGFPKMDLCITSPPYMPRHHKWNPLYSGNPDYTGYDNYLKRMGFIFEKLALQMKRNSFTVIHADNLKQGHNYTPLVRDLALAMEPFMTLKAEIIVNWNNAQPDYPHTHCLVFKNGKTKK